MQRQRLQTPEPPVYRQAAPSRPPVGGGGGLSTDELLRELDVLQGRAKEQQATLAAAGRMPPPSPLLEQLRDEEASSGVYSRPVPAREAPAMPERSPGVAAGHFSGMGQHAAPVPADAPLLRRRDDFGRFLQARQSGGLGVVLGVGTGAFALRLLADWVSTPGLYLVDPYIHIWTGYDDPSNLADHEHQQVFEELRNRLAPYEGRYELVRDFSHSFAQTFQQGGQAPGSPTFVYVDANHAEQACARDLQLWWPLLGQGGLLAGGSYTNSADGRVRVKAAVDHFADRVGAKVYLTHDDMPPSWFIFKQ